MQTLSRSPREESREETGRAARVPFGVARSKLSVPGRPGYVRRWVNDAEGRLQQAEQGGYQFAKDDSLQIGVQDVDNVNRDLGARVSRVVDKTTGQKAYLMEIKKEFYDEDQATKAAALKVTEKQILEGRIGDTDSRYVPKGGISIQKK